MRGPQVVYGPEDEGGALTVEQAIASLNASEPDEDATAPEAPQAAAAGSEEIAAEASPAETPEGAAETPQPEGDEGAVQQQAETLLEPPLYWKPEAKARFAQLDPELQAEILAQEGPREQSASKAKAEAAQIREAAERELKGVSEFAEKVQPLLQQARQTFGSRWGDNPDWLAYAAQYGSEATTIAKLQYESEREQLQGLEQAARAAEVKAHQEYVKGEYEKLKTVAPDLTDPEKGAERRAEVVQYLQKIGIPENAVLKISAVEMNIARKAMLWDQAQAKGAKPIAAPRPAPQTTKPLARGAASAGAVDPKAKAAQTAKNRFAQTRSINDAIALLNMQDE